MLLTNASSVLAYLPASGLVGPLTSDVVNPSTTAAGEFGGQVVALALNVDFSDAHVTEGNRGIPFGDLELHDLAQTALNDLTVREFLDEMNISLGGREGFFYAISDLNDIVEELNGSFAAGDVTQWARSHLRVADIPGDYNHNGIVDAADYVLWRNDEVPPPAGYTTWRSNFGRTSAAPAATADVPSSLNPAVPEPATAGLALVGLLGLVCRRSVVLTLRVRSSRSPHAPFG